MRLAIIGSRTFNDYELLEKSIIANFMIDNIDLIVSGGANGADKLGEKFANVNNIQTIIFKPDWNKYGKSAGFIRNKLIVDNCDSVVAFWDSKSKGTKHSLDYAKKTNKNIIIIRF